MKNSPIHLGIIGLCVACTGGTGGTDGSKDNNSNDSGYYDTSDTSYYDTSDTSYYDTSDTGTPIYEGDTSIGVDSSNASYPTDGQGNAKEAINASCSSHQYDFEFYTIGLTGGGQLQIEGAGWEEDHYIGSAEFDADGWWDQLQLTLPHVDPDTDGDGYGDTYGSDGWKMQENNTTSITGNTLYNCTHFETQSSGLALTYQLTVFDLDNQKADCAVWGNDPGAFSDGCETWN